MGEGGACAVLKLVWRGEGNGGLIQILPKSNNGSFPGERGMSVVTRREKRRPGRLGYCRVPSIQAFSIEEWGGENFPGGSGQYFRRNTTTGGKERYVSKEPN